MEVYLYAFFNFKQNDWAKFLPMSKYIYNNAMNINTSYTPFELNYGYYFWILYKGEVNSYSWSKSTNKLLVELRELIIIC